MEQVIYCFGKNKRVIAGFVVKTVKKRCRADAIVITKSYAEMGQLMRLTGHLNWENYYKGQYPYNSDTYNDVWVWTIKDGSYSGSSGYKVLENHVSRNPNLPLLSTPEAYRYYSELVENGKQH